MFWPVHLTCFYPHPVGNLQTWKVIAAAIALIFISIVAFRERRRHPYGIVGWLWFMGTLVPVLGLVQVGSHAMADRYTYVPLIGLFIAASWSFPVVGRKWGLSDKGMGAIAGLLLVALMVRTSDQVALWRDGVTLMQHNVDVTPPNFQSHNLLGEAFLSQDRYKEAIEQYEEGLVLSPNQLDLHYNLGNALAKIGKLEDAVAHYNWALRVNPENADVHNNLALVLVRQGKIDEALSHYDQALRINPGLKIAQFNKQLALERKEKGEKASEDDAVFDMAVALARVGRDTEAIKMFSKVLSGRPDLVKARYNLAVLLAKQGALEKAVLELSEALRLKPDFTEARKLLETLREMQQEK